MACVQSVATVRIGRFNTQPHCAVHNGYALALLLALVPAHAEGQPNADARKSASTPRHVYVMPCLRVTVARMLERSETFREQMATIAGAPRLGVAITFEPSNGGNPARAEIRRYASGVIVAIIRIRSLHRHEELLAHELEHVREQLEGLSLARLAQTGNRVWEAGTAYETDRAVTVGRRVAREMRSAEAQSP